MSITTKKLLDALLDRKYKPKISSGTDRLLLEQIGNNILDKNKAVKDVIDYSKIMSPEEYKNIKNFNKRRGSELAYELANKKQENLPITRTFSKEEKPFYLNWHQQHRSNAKIPTPEDIYWRDYDEAYRQANMSTLLSRNFKEPDIKLNNKEFKELQNRVSRYNQHFGTNVRTTPDKNGKWDDRFIRAIRLAEQKKYEQRYAKKQIKQETDAFVGVDNVYDGNTPETYKNEFNDYIKQFYDEEI